MRRFLRMGAAVATLCCGGGVATQSDPKPIDAAAWMTTDDYPEELLLKRVGGTADITVQVDPKGRVTGCRVAKSTGSEQLDALSCRLIVARGTFRPATDAKGAAIAGQWQGKFGWQVPQDSYIPLTSYAKIQRIVFDGKGTILSCAGENVDDFGYVLPECIRLGGDYLVPVVLEEDYRDGTLTVFAQQHVEGIPLPPDAPRTDVPPNWTEESDFTVQPDGTVTNCKERRSDTGPADCRQPPRFLPLSDGKSRRVTTEVRWAFQPAQ